MLLFMVDENVNLTNLCSLGLEDMASHNLICC